MNNNRNNSIEEILKRGASVRLSSFDKNEIRKSLINAMEEVPSSPFSQPRSLRIVSWSYTFMRFPAVAALVLVMTAGTSLAAQGTVPGDTLYPIKIGLNEKVETFFAVGTKGSATVTAKHALTRLAEAEVLAAEGRLDAKTKADVEQHFYEKVADLRSNLKRLEGRGDFNAAANISGSFEEKLGEHLGAFVDLSTNVGTGTMEVSEIANSVGVEIQSTQIERTAVRERQVANAPISTRVIAQSAANDAQKKITEVEMFIGKASTSATVELALGERLGSAREAILRGATKLSEGSYSEAFGLFKKAETLAQDAKLLSIIGTKVKKGLTVRTTPSRDFIAGKGADEKGGVEAAATLRAALPTFEPLQEDLKLTGDEGTGESDGKVHVESKSTIDIAIDQIDADKGDEGGIRVNISI